MSLKLHNKWSIQKRVGGCIQSKITVQPPLKSSELQSKAGMPKHTAFFCEIREDIWGKEGEINNADERETKETREAKGEILNLPFRFYFFLPLP